jgi:hypothetical protein
MLKIAVFRDVAINPHAFDKSSSCQSVIQFFRSKQNFICKLNKLFRKFNF